MKTFITNHKKLLGMELTEDLNELHGTWAENHQVEEYSYESQCNEQLKQTPDWVSNKDISKDYLKVFIAGSKILSVQRNILRAVLMKQQGLFNLMIEAKTFEDFPNSLIVGGAQNTLYNKYISREADIVVFVLDEHIGGFTKQEFDVAYKNFVQSKRPYIFIYSKRVKDYINVSINQFKKELSSIHQYYIEYDNDKELEYYFEKSITEYLIKTYFNDRVRSPKEQIGFEIACQNLSTILISCLNVIDELGYIIKNLSINWEKFLLESSSNPVKENILICKEKLLNALNHYLDKERRISKIYPPSKISLSKGDIELLASQVKDIPEITELPLMYSNIFNIALEPFRAIQDYLLDAAPPLLKRRIINFNIQGFFFLANAFFYTLLEYFTQLPKGSQKNLKEFQNRWLFYPKNISINLPPDEYERFSKREFDEYEKNIIKLKAVIEHQDNELDKLKLKIDEIIKPQLNLLLQYCPSCGSQLIGDELFCTQCGKKL